MNSNKCVAWEHPRVVYNTRHPEIFFLI